MTKPRPSPAPWIVERGLSSMGDPTPTPYATESAVADPAATGSAEPADSLTDEDDDMMDVFWQYTDAYVFDDYSAYRDLLSKDCRNKYSVSDIGAFLSKDRVMLEAIYGDDPRYLEIGEPTVERDGDWVTLTYERYKHDGLPVPSPAVTEMVREDGDWFVANCDFDRRPGTSAATAKPDSGTDTGTDTDTETDTDTGTDATAAVDNADAVPLGEPAPVSIHWSLAVNSVDLDANDLVEVAPSEGMRFVLVNVTATNTSNASNALLSLGISATGEGTGTVSYRPTDDQAKAPAPKFYDFRSVVAPDGSRTGNVLLEVPTVDLDTLVLGADDRAAQTETTYFATK